MGKIAERIQQFKNTFGIEVEFCSHDSEILGFTHITVCTITHEFKGNNYDWKIETDADYTLELVSPILTFTDHQAANAFKATLMAMLDKIVREQPTLHECAEAIHKFLQNESSKNSFRYLQEQELSLYKESINYIKIGELFAELDYHNWDTDTNLRRVLGKKRHIKKLQQLELENQHLKTVILRPSEKHGGLPSSQLNHPMNLLAYVWYSAHVKEPKAWYRLIASPNDEFLKDWRNTKKKSIEKQYQHLSNIWKDRYLNNDYLEQRQNENIKIWHRYWFWLVSIREITEKALDGIYEDKNKSRLKFKEAKELLLEEEIKHNALFPLSKIWEFLELSYLQKIYQEDTGIITPDNTITMDEDKGYLYSAFYVTIHKLISGALGVLSESNQLELQKLIMNMEDEVSSDDLNSCVSNPEFLDFHYALKDLTPLWFKGSLADVLNNLPKTGSENQANIVQQLKLRLQQALTGDAVEEILNKNIKFLGRIYVLNEYFHDGNNYDWDKFKEDLLPSVSGFVRQFEKGKNKLIESLQPQNLESFTYKTLHQQKKDKTDKFLDRTDVPAWEGRWDTIKPLIPSNNETEFLVEHRNN